MLKNQTVVATFGDKPIDWAILTIFIMITLLVVALLVIVSLDYSGSSNLRQIGKGNNFIHV